MTALAAERDTPRMGNDAVVELLQLPIDANVKIWKGSIVSINAGYARPGRTSTTDVVAGIAIKTYDNTGGALGAITNVEVRRGAHFYENSTAGDLLAQLDVGNVVYLVDDQTVAKTNGGATRVAAGRMLGIDTVNNKILVQVGVIV